MKAELEEKDEIISDLSRANEELESYVEILMKSEGIAYKGKNISDVKKKNRGLKCFLSRAKTALWFAESFGLEICSITVAEKKTGLTHPLSVDEKGENTDDEKACGFDGLSSEEKKRVEELLFLLDKFYVGDGFYHELSMVVDSLPKSYLIKQRRDQLNKLCVISQTPGKTDGCQLNFEDSLKEHLECFISENPKFDLENNSVRIKLSGDGAQMTRNTNFIIMSFAFLDGNGNAMSAKGNHTIAVIKESECYQVMKESLRDVFSGINSLNSTKKIEVGNKNINLEFFLGGDYKFLLMVLGLQSATSNHSCLWCKVHKNQRWDMSHNLSYYNSPPLNRTIEEIKQMAGKKKDNYGCVNPPLIEIDLDHVILDELHLMLRVVDVLIDNILEDVLEWDKIDDLSKRRCEEKGKHLDNFVNAVRSCGVSFNVWQKAGTTGPSKFETTSLRGDDKKILLTLLPNKLELVIQEDTCEIVTEVWKDFNELYKIITKLNPTADDISGYFEKAKNWVLLFLSLGGRRKGYNRARVTPYMHAMVYHIPIFFNKFKSLKIYTGQGVECNNDVARSTVQRKSNNWDSTSDVLKLESRQWKLHHHERTKRVYKKSNNVYWEEQIFESRQQKRKKTKQ